MKKYIMFAGSLVFASFALQSCLDYDDPGAELGVGSTTTETTEYIGNVDTIPFRDYVPTEAGVRLAIDSMNKLGYFGQSLGGQFNMRGG